MGAHGVGVLTMTREQNKTPRIDIPEKGFFFCGKTRTLAVKDGGNSH
jgi:hypothetical protein